MLLQPFWVPLHAQAKRMIGQLDAFDEMIWSIGYRPQGWSQLLEALVVQRIYLKCLATQGLRQVAARFN